MEHYLLLKIVHSVIAVLLFLGMPAHGFMLWKAQRGGNGAVLQRKLRNTRRFSLPAFAVLALSMPVSGWWLIDIAGWPLSQTWLLASNILFVALMILCLLLAGRLSAWQALGDTPAPSGLLRLTSVYAGLIVLLLLVIMALMGAKPV